MMAGHLAVGLAAKKADKTLNLGIFFFLALFADFILGILVLAGIEQVHTPANYQDLHYLTFTFPFSHGLTATLFWSVLTFLAALLIVKGKNRYGIALLSALTVFSHFVLDWIVHIPEIPLLGTNSPKLGLGLWNQLEIALLLEVGLVIIGLGLYLHAIWAEKKWTHVGIVLLVLLATVATVGGQAFSNTPPPLNAPAMTWIGQSIIIGLLAFWLDRKPKLSKPAQITPQLETRS